MCLAVVVLGFDMRLCLIKSNLLEMWIFWICVLIYGFVFLFKTHLDLNSYNFLFLILFLIFLFS